MNDTWTLTKRTLRRRASHFLRQSLGTLGKKLPFAIKLGLARKSTKLGYLLLNDGDFVLDDYLGSFRVHVNAKSHAERALIRGAYEPETREVIAQMVQPGDYCLDIGANIGAVTLELCQRVGPEGKVHCFEPGPPFFERLQNNLALNPAMTSRTALHQLGLSDAAGELFWEEDKGAPGNAFLFGEKGQRVPVTTLDAFFSGGLPRLDFLKIDVEGMELEVLRGGRHLIATHRPRIYFETLMDFEVFRGKPIRRDAAEFLQQLGYHLYSVDAGVALKPAFYPHFAANTLALPEALRR